MVAEERFRRLLVRKGFKLVSAVAYTVGYITVHDEYREADGWQIEMEPEPLDWPDYPTFGPTVAEALIQLRSLEDAP